MMEETKVLLVDDHALVRGALAERLKREPGLCVVGCVGTADEAIARTRESRPDVVLMDIDMPGMISFDAAREIARMWPKTRIVFLSAFTHDHYIQEALDVKARGYLTKRETPERVISAIREVALGGACFSDDVQARIIVDGGGVKMNSIPRARVGMLRPRERETLRYIAKGMTTKEIAEHMSIATKTVEHHTARIMNALGIHNRVELTRFAIRENLVEP